MTIGRNLRKPSTLLVAILAATTFVYLRAASFAFVYDDAWEIVDNIEIRSWAYVGHFFTARVLRTPYYRPLFVLWFRINDALFGLNPAGWHVMSILVHVLVTALVYLLVRRLAGSTAALIAAAVFGLHPVHIESVAWVSGVCDPISAVFLLGAFLAYLKASDVAQARTPWSAGKWTIAACLLFALALLTKEPPVVFPALIATHAFLFAGSRRQGVLSALRRSAPFLAVAALYLVVRQSIIPFSVNAGPNLPVATVLFTVPSVLWFYVSRLFWPVDLNAFYDLPYVGSPSVSHFIFPVMLLIAIVAGLWYWARRSRDGNLIAFCAAWFLITLAPALYVRVLPPGEIAHDRYLYVPSIGFCALVAIALTRWPERSAVAEGKSPTQLPVAVAVALCLAFAGLNLAQQGYWASDTNLYSHGYAAAPANNNVANNYARLLTDRGLYGQAIPIYEQVLSRNPDSGTAHYNLGYTYYRLGEFAKARLHLERAVQIDPLDGFAYVHIGLVELLQNHVNDAEVAIRHGIKLAPGRPGCHLALSFVLERKGDLSGAIAEMKNELQYSPDNQALQQRERLLEQRVVAR